MRALEGFQGFRAVQVADDQVVLVIFADTADVLDRIATDLGNAWMGANVAPFLAGAAGPADRPDHRVGRRLRQPSP